VGVVRRLRQGLRALFAFAQRVDTALPEATLSAAQLTLFRRMQRSEQIHAVNVLRELLAQAEPTPDDLAVVALLHDVGKVRHPLRVWSKTLGVLLRVFMPGLFQRWSRGNVRNPLQRACIVMTQHPVWGAELVAEAGATEPVVWLVEHHADSPASWQDHPHRPFLERLQQADDAH
jgi:hypothetical protein